MNQERSMEAILRTLREAHAREEAQSTTIVYFLCVNPCPTRQSRYVGLTEYREQKDCLDCGELVHRWSGIHDFIDCQPIRP
jgi:hypothetical protein